MGGLDAPTLVDGDVDDHRTRAHPTDHRLTHHDRGSQTGDEHRPDHQVGLSHRALDRPSVRRERDDAAAVDLVDEAQPVEVLVEEHDLGLHARCDPRRVPADVPGAEDNDASGPHSRSASEQHPPAAVLTLEVVGAGLGREPSCDLAHRCE